MSLNFQRGDLINVQWFPSGFGTNAVLNIKGYDLSFESLMIDVTSTASGGVRSRLAGLRDWSINVKASYDADQPPYTNPPEIVDGIAGILLVSVNIIGSRFWQLPSIIAKVHYVSGLEQELQYDFDLKANSRAGLLVFPSFP